MQNFDKTTVFLIADPDKAYYITKPEHSSVLKAAERIGFSEIIP